MKMQDILATKKPPTFMKVVVLCVERVSHGAGKDGFTI